MLRFCFDSQVVLDNFYTKLIKDNEVKKMIGDKNSETSFTMDEIADMMAKRDALIGAHAIFNGYLDAYINGKKLEVDVDSVIGLSTGELSVLIQQQKKPELINFYSSLLNTKAAIETNTFNMGNPMATYNDGLKKYKVQK